MSAEVPDNPAPLDQQVVESRATVLCLMDALVSHLNDEEDRTGWLMNGVPDGGPGFKMTEEQRDYYADYVDDFEDMVKLFATIVSRVCFKKIYKPKGFC